jgi:hypothetical protein
MRVNVGSQFKPGAMRRASRFVSAMTGSGSTKRIWRTSSNHSSHEERRHGDGAVYLPVDHRIAW